VNELGEFNVYGFHVQDETENEVTSLAGFDLAERETSILRDHKKSVKNCQSDVFRVLRYN
jgi:hypothetical protein